MGVFDFVRNGVREMMVARPDSLKHLIVYKHPDQNIPMHAQLTVDSDECAVFFKDGRVVGIIPPGRVTLQSQNIPFLNALVTSFTGGQVLITEIFFVKTSPVRSLPFGGPIGEMIDPLTGEQVQPRIFGEMSVVVVDPVRFIVAYSGQAASGSNDDVLNWLKGCFLNGVKTTLGELCENEGKSLLQAVSLTSRLAAAFTAHAPDLNDAGVKILQVGTFNINFNEEDRQRLVSANAEIAKAQRQAKVKQIGVAGLGAQMAIGVGMGSAMAGGMVQPIPAPTFSPGGTQVTCGKCGAAQPGGKFCAECGTPLVAQVKFCGGCGAQLSAHAKFCPGCGTAVAR
jgi:membrane protease subunit (stomatin/prohibitin family)